MVTNNQNHEILLSFMRISLLLTDIANKFLAKYKTTDIEFNILMTLAKYENGLGQSDLSQKLVIKKSNLVGIIDKLEAKKLVKRKRGVTDRRANTIHLTQKSHEFLYEVKPFYFEKVNELVSELETEDKQQLSEVIKKLEKSLEAVESS